MKYTKSELRNGCMPLLRRIERQQQEKRRIIEEDNLKQNKTKTFSVMSSKIKISNLDREVSNFIKDEDFTITRLGRYNKRSGR